MLLLLLTLTAAFADPAPMGSPPAHVVQSGPRSTVLDLYRPYPDADKILVPVGLPDGSEELFIVDTGAATSTISKAVAARLSLDPSVEAGVLMGLGGIVPWIRTTIPRIQLGVFQLNAVDMAVDVAGVPEALGALPVAGILGNNIWSNFLCVVDYSADRLELYLDPEVRVPRKAAPMIYDGRSVETQVTIDVRRGKERVRATVPLEVDTGAHDILLLREVGEPFRALTSVGEEPILGIGADLDKLPDRMLLQQTRRIPIDTVEAGGASIPIHEDARWLCADGGCPSGRLMPGLLGYRALAERRVIFDFPGRRFAIVRSRLPARDFDGNAAWLAREQARGVPNRAGIRARLAWASDQRDVARREIDQGLASLPGDPELTVLKAWTQRSAGSWEAAIQTLSALPPDDLAEQGEWVGYVGSLILADRAEEAVAIAQAALDGALVVPDHREDFYVALSDALLATGRANEARRAIDGANAASPKGGSAHLIRKARIAQASGDRYGAIVVLRELMENIPLQGLPFWLYGTLAEAPDVETYSADVDRALARLHAGSEPWDFVGAGYHAVGDLARAEQALKAGYARDCVPLAAGAPRANCEAWYWGLGVERLPEAEARIKSALAAEPDNSSYLDTATVVFLAAGQPTTALGHALHAARLQPDDPYLHWQVSRLRAKVTVAADHPDSGGRPAGSG